MMKNAVNINWDYIGDAVPAFVALAMIPFTCEYWILIPAECNAHATPSDPDNIAYGIIAGIILFIILHNVPLLLGKISPRLLPPGWHDLKEPYDVGAMIKNQSKDGKPNFKSLFPPWLRKLLSGNKRFWQYTPEEIQRHLEGRTMANEADNAAAELRQKERDDMRKGLGQTLIRDREVLPDHLSYDPEGAQRTPASSTRFDDKDTPTPAGALFSPQINRRETRDEKNF